MKCYFKSDFKPRYEKTGKKNLRCFPTCCESGHITTGFCGQPIDCVISLHPSHVVHFSSSGHILDRLEFWGEIVRSKDQPANSKRMLNQNGPQLEASEQTEFELNHFDKLERTKQNPVNRYMRGKIEKRLEENPNEIQFLVRFNEKKVVSDNGDQLPLPGMANKHLTTVNVFYSPSFKLYSRHRVRKHRQLIQNGVQAASAIPDYDKNFAVKVRNASLNHSRHSQPPHKPKREIITQQTSFPTALPDISQQFLNTENKRRRLGSFDMDQVSLGNAFQNGFGRFNGTGRRNSLAGIDPSGMPTHVPSSVGPALFNGDNNVQLNFLLSQLRAGLQPNFFLNNGPPPPNYMQDMSGAQGHGSLFANAVASAYPQQTEQAHLNGNVLAPARSMELCFLDLHGEDVLTLQRLILFIIFFSHGNADKFTQDFFSEKTKTTTPAQDEKEAEKLRDAALEKLFLTTVSPGKAEECSEVLDKDMILHFNLNNDYAAITALRRFVSAHGDQNLKRNIIRIIWVLEDLARSIIVETDLSEQISEIFNSWLDDPTVFTLSEKSEAGEKLKELLKDENSNKDEIEMLWYTETVKFNQEFGRLMSLSQEVMQLIYSFIVKFLKERNETFSSLKEALAIAAESGLLGFDPKREPLKLPSTLAKMLLESLNQRHRAFLGSVDTEGPHNTLNTDICNNWETMFFKILQQLSREAITLRVEEERILKAIELEENSLEGKFEELEYAQGVWEFVSASVDPVNNPILEKVLFDLYGVTTTMFVGKLLTQIFSKIQIKITPTAFMLQGQKKLFSNASYIFNLSTGSKAEPQTLLYPLPIPFPCSLQELQVVSWLETLPENDSEDAEAPVIRMVFGGSIVDRHGALQKVRGGNECPKQLFQRQHIRLHATIKLSTDVTTLSTEIGLAFYPEENGESAADVPPLNNIDKLRTLFESSESKIWDVKYKRGF